MSAPPRPGLFAPNRAPEWVELKLSAYRTASGLTWWESRPIIRPRLQLVHTNGASREGSIESAINWGNANPGSNTHPHYQVDRHRAAKLVPTNRKGIGNKTIVSARGTRGDVADWSLVIETADEGYPTPGEDGGFIGAQPEMIAQILAYEAMTHDDLTLLTPTEWWGAGTAAHTDPFGYPYWTNAQGKVCPGRTKKRQLREQILPRAREIYAAWTEEPVLEYFTLKPMPATLWATSDHLTAVRIESSVLVARGVDISKVPVLPPHEAARLVYLQGLTSDSVK